MASFRRLAGKQDPPKELEAPAGGARACYLNINCEPGQTSAILSELKTIAKAHKIQQPPVFIPGDNVVNAKFVRWRERDKFQGFLESAFKVSWLAFVAGVDPTLELSLSLYKPEVPTTCFADQKA